MRKRILVFLFFFMLAPTHAFSSEQAKQEKQLQALKARIASVEQNLKQVRQQSSKESNALEAIETKLGHINKALRTLKNQVAEKQKAIDVAKQKQKTLRAKVGQQKTALEDQLRSAHLMGQQQRVKLMLNQKDPARLSRIMQYFDYFNQARVDEVEALNINIDELQSVEALLSEEQVALRNLLGKQKKEQTQLTQNKTERKKILLAYQQQEHSSSQELNTLKADEKALRSLIESLKAAIDDIPSLKTVEKPFAQLKGKLPWPTKGRIAKRYGSARKSGRYDGVLISAREGTPIKAISHGRVVYADWLRGYGLLIIVDHGGDYMSLYAFNEGLYKEVGDWVLPGEVVASVGVSGGQSKAGLYFSIRKNGKPVNPTTWCRASKRGMVG